MTHRVRWDLAAGIVLLVGILRVYQPSLITIFGQAGGTPAEYLGGYAVVWFLIALAAVPLARRIPAGRVALVAGLALVVLRLALSFVDGGNPQLHLATAALLAALVWLTASAMTGTDPRAAMVAIVTGLAVSTAVHALLDGVDIAWRHDPTAVVVLVAQLAWFLVALVRRHTGTPTDTGNPGSARPWLLVGPTLLLWGMYGGNIGYLQSIPGFEPGTAAAFTVLVGAAAVMVVARPRRITGHRVVPAILVVISAIMFGFVFSTVDDIRHLTSPLGFVAVVAGQFGLAGCLGWAAAGGGTTSPVRRGTATGGGMFVYVALLFAFYAAYDLGHPNRWVPLVTAILIAVVTVTGNRPAAMRTTAIPQPIGFAVATVLAVVAAVWAPHQFTDTHRNPAAHDTDDGLRVAAYNLRMGFGQAGTFTVDEQAAALAELEPQVIMLSEVDRGWWLNGGQDLLHGIAERLGMRAVWAPAADELWGDAILTELPITSVDNRALVPGGPTGAQALRVGIRWHDTDVTLIATHTQPPSGWSDLQQAEQLAILAADSAADGTPVILAGDLNTEPDDPAFQVLTGSGLRDAFADNRPVPSTPGDDPQQIDHILVTEGITVTDVANPDVDASDHRPVAATLHW